MTAADENRESAAGGGFSPDSPSCDDAFVPAHLGDEEAGPSPLDADLVTDPSETVKPLSASAGRHARQRPATGRLQSELEPDPLTDNPIPSATLRQADAADDLPADAPGEEEELIRHKHRRRRRRVPIAAKVLLVFVAVIGVAVAAGAAYISSIDSAMSMDEDDAEELSAVLAPTDAEAESDAFYVLCIGSDAREDDEASRSDVIMLCRVESSTCTVTLVSIPRDTMIYSTGGDVEKINAEYNKGAAATVKAVSKFAGVDISHYVEIDFEGLETLVDTLGGVWVDVPADVDTDIVQLVAGEQLLDGETALAYARARHGVSGGDFSRTQAQRLIVEAIINQVLKCTPSEIPGVIADLAASVSTDLSVADIVTYALKFVRSDYDVTVYSAVTPSYTLYQNGVSYVGTEYAEWRTMMQLVDAGLDPNDDTQEIPEDQANNDDLGSASNAASPEDYEELVESAGLTTDDVAEVD